MFITAQNLLNTIHRKKFYTILLLFSITTTIM